MKLNKLSRTTRLIIIIIGAATILSACKRHSVKHRNAERHAVPPPHVAPTTVANAQHHGDREQHSYRYYPDSQVYFDTNTSNYFYRKHDNWLRTDSLPGSLHLDENNWVNINMDSAKPYSQHRRHQKKYPHGWKKKNRGSNGH